MHCSVSTYTHALTTHAYVIRINNKAKCTKSKWKATKYENKNFAFFKKRKEKKRRKMKDGRRRRSKMNFLIEHMDERDMNAIIQFTDCIVCVKAEKLRCEKHDMKSDFLFLFSGIRQWPINMI